jgi:hypothetical protein
MLETWKQESITRHNSYAISIPNGGSRNSVSQIKVPYIAAKYRVSRNVSQQAIINKLWMIYRGFSLAGSRFSEVLTRLTLVLALALLDCRED